MIDNTAAKLKRSELIYLFLAIMFLAFLLFGNGIKGDFVLDDHVVVQGRTGLQNIFDLSAIFKSGWLPGTVFVGNYRPLTLFSFAFNFLFSKGPAGFHILNILIHALNVFLVFILVERISSRRTAYLTSFLFLFLPIHVEAVTSIVGRKDLLGALFILCSLLLFFKKRHVFASLCFFLALLSSDFAVAFLPLIAVLLLIENRSLLLSFKTFCYYLAPLPIYFGLRYWALGKYVLGQFRVNPIVAPMASLPLKERIFTGFFNFFLYLKKTFYPVNLSPDYSFNQIPAVHNLFSSPEALVGVSVFVLFVAAFFLLRKEFKIAATMFIVSFAVMSDILFVSGGSVAERRWYLPSLGLLFFISLAIDALLAKSEKLKPALWFLGVPVLLVFSFATIAQNKIWLNDHNLFVAAAERSPNSVWTRTNLATIYYNEKNYEGARRELEAAFKFSEDYTPALTLWGKLMWRQGNYEEAERAFKKALNFDYSGKNSRIIYKSLAFLSFDLGKNGEAISFMEQVLKSQAQASNDTELLVDKALYEMLKRNRNRSVSSYTPKERQELNDVIKSVLDL